MEAENHDNSLVVWVKQLHTDENHDIGRNQDPMVKVVILNRKDEGSQYEESMAFKTSTKNLGGTDVAWERDQGSFRISERNIHKDTQIAFVVYDVDWTSKEFIG